MTNWSSISMAKHRGKFKWKKYSEHKGNLRDYWTRWDRTQGRHHKEEEQ
jgi:hypothetical protein